MPTTLYNFSGFMFFIVLAAIPFIGYSQKESINKDGSLSRGQTVRDVQVLNKQESVAVGYNGLIAKTIDGGQNWKTITTPSDKSLLGLHFIDSKIGYAVGDNLTILKTIDGGKTWKKKECSFCVDNKAALMDIVFVDADTGYAVGGLGTILKTNDKGETWVPIGLSTPVGLNSIFFLRDKKTGFIAGGSKCVFKTTDAGKSWQKYIAGLQSHVLDIYFTDDKNGYAVGAEGFFYKSGNGGENWEAFKIGDPNTRFRSIIFGKNKYGYATGNFNGVMVTQDNGKTWQTKILNMGGTSRSIFAVDMRDGQILVGGDGGFLYKSTDAGKIWQDVSYIKTNALGSLTR